jgi:hypothetical protein
MTGCNAVRGVTASAAERDATRGPEAQYLKESGIWIQDSGRVQESGRLLIPDTCVLIPAVM